MQATSLDSSDGASKHELVRHSPFEAPLSSHQSLNFDHERPSAGWTHADDELLMLSRAQGMNWAPIANTYFPNKTPNACRKRHERLMEKRFATNSDGVSLEDLARSYMETRETMWTILADKVGEKWEHVETKVLSISSSFECMINVYVSAWRKASRRCNQQLDPVALNKHSAEAILQCRIVNLMTREFDLNHLG